MKILLFISAICWGAYAFAYNAWFAFMFDIVGLIGLIIYFIKPYKSNNKTIL